VQSFGKIAALQQIGESLEELSDVNGSPVKVEKAFPNTAMEMTLEIRIGHMSRPPFWM
jgi:hypothetical protein